jgi:hypothetical protein
MRTELLRFPGAVERDLAIDAWMDKHTGGRMSGRRALRLRQCIPFARKRARLLQGEGKFMRHVKLRPGTATNTAAL